MRVGVIGVGAMGAAMAGHLTRGGHDVTAFDVDDARIAAAREAGARPASGLEDVSRSAELIIVMVATDEQSRQVVGGLAASAAAGTLIAVTATNHPDNMRSLAREAAAGGLRFIDAPVVFGLQGAKDGELVSLCGGSAEDIEFARPALMAYSRAIHRVGPVGAGQLAKACNNMLHWAACVANYEVLLLAKRFGVDAQHMREILLDCPGQNGTLARWDTTRFTWPEKDMDIALDLAQTGGLSLPLFGQVDQLVKLLGPDQVRDLLYGGETTYLGTPVGPLPGAVTEPDS